ncbi:M48 family metalloprotease [Chloracidobacterium sp. MS 40/45]|uniref:M48 family metalloprotease n=1 Tax=Chloracidobacterium aggregatum TaxID=2851959 RepID=UPI001B8DA774|nr:M48 family metalloprotease [Chloracidobacterium aggregatum]QUV99202.1 M48 family metalloprotease [Chloracidobacterium sp. MS 40/45]
MTNQTALLTAGRAYQDFRLWSGIGAIGWNLMFFTVFILAGGHVALFRGLGIAAQPTVGMVMLGLAVFYAMYAAVNAPLELLTGWAAERSFAMTQRTLRHWLVAYLTGVAGQGVMFVLGLTALWQSYQWLPDWWWLAAAVLVGGVSLVLALLQPFLLPPVVRRKPFDAPQVVDAVPPTLRSKLPKLVVFTGDADEAVNGGLVGWGPTTQLWVSQTTLDKLRPEQVACLLVREVGHLQTGHRTLGVLVSSLWLATGLAVAATLTNFGLNGGLADLLTLAVGMTWWNFAGLFVLPALGRRSVLAADRFFLSHGGAPRVLRDTLITLAEINRAQPDITGRKQQVFHPLPSLDTRLSHLATAQPGNHGGQ